MEETPKSKGEQHIEHLMHRLDPESERYRVLDTAKRFKSSWVALGEELTRVFRGNLFREWGFDSFEEYCAREIRIQKPTAQKLTRAYHYLEEKEPELLARQAELKPLPDYRSVDLLRQAREEEAFSAEEYAALRQAVVDEERSHPTVRKRFQEVVDARGDHETDPQEALKKALAAARRLETALEEVPDLPAKLSGQHRRLREWLEEAAGE